MLLPSDAGRSCSRHVSLALSAAVYLALSAGPAGAKATFTTFDAGAATGINSANTVTGFNATQAFVRTADGTVTFFDVPGGTRPEALSINDAGEVTGFYDDSSENWHGFVRAADGTIATFAGPKADSTVPLHINNKGVISGHYHSKTGEHGFVRTAAGRIRTLDVPGAVETYPGCIDDKGAIAGFFIDSNDFYHGFLRAPDGALASFDVPGAADTFALCLNSKGVVTGSYLDSDGREGFVRAAGGTITTFSGTDCDVSPAGIDRKGIIAGYCEDRENPKHALGFVRKPDGAIDEFHVPAEGPHTMAWGINDSGVIAGDDGAGGFLRFP